MKTLRSYISAFFDLFAPPAKEDLIDGEAPIRTWKEMIVPIILTLFLMGIIILSN